MGTSRTIRTDIDGPVRLTAKTSSIDLTVIAEPGRTHGEVTLETADDSGSSADIVRKATLETTGDRMRVVVEEGTAGGITVRSTGRGGSMISVGRVTGGVVFGSGVTVVNGQVVSGNAVVIEPGSPITLTARVPAGSTVNVHSQSGSLEATGELAAASLSSQSGSAYLESVGSANLSTMSGSIDVRRLTGQAQLKSMSGNIDVHGPAGAYASASTMSGNVTGGGGLELDGSSMSGRVRNRP